MNATVLLADDQSLIRTAVRALIESSPDLTVVGEATNGQEALEQARLLRPDVVLMDIRMPIMDGIEATKQICNDPDLSEIRVLILTTFEEDEYIVEALRAGASGFIGKGTEPTALIQAIATVHGGESLLSPVATPLLVDRYVRAAPPKARTRTTPVAGLDELTDREREVLFLVAAGLSNSEIAQRLFISPSTAKTHVNRIMTKLYAHDRAQLVIAAYQSGLV
jgi:DNA-binding NarL/FixJ family response regulator